MNRFILSGATAAALLVPFLNVSAEKQNEISKVNYFHLNAKQQDQTSLDPMIRFQRKEILHGAVTLQEQLDRYGSYYTINWRVLDRAQPVTVRFEYRQQRTANEIYTKEIEITDIKRKNFTRFGVFGDEFVQHGNVIAWKASILQGDQVLAEKESFLWD